MVKPIGPIPEPPPQRPEGELPRCRVVGQCAACGYHFDPPVRGPFIRTYCENALGDGQECLKVTCPGCGYVWHEKLDSAPMSEYDLVMEEWRHVLREFGKPDSPEPLGIRRLWAWATGRKR